MFEEKLEVLIDEVLKKGISKQTMGTTFPFEINQDLFEAISQYLQSNEAIKLIFDNKMMCAGNGYSRIQINTLSEWLIASSSKTGIKKTVKKLMNFLKLDYTPIIAILAVSGIEPSERIQLSDTIELIPFVDLPQSKAKNALYPSFLKENPGVDILNPALSAYNPPKMALVKKVQLKPKAYDKDIAEADTMNMAYNDLYEACDFLTLHSSSTPVAVGNWAELDEEVPCKNMLGAGFSYPSTEIIVRMDIPFHKYEWEKIQSIYHQFTKLDSQTKNLLCIVLQRLNQARRRQRVEDKAIDQGIAFEVLLLNDKEHKNGISWKLRNRAAYILEEEIEAREKLCEFFKAFYNCRSKATHVGKIDNNVNVTNRGMMKIHDLLEESDQLCIKAIKKIILNGGFLNWDEITLKVVKNKEGN